MLVILISTNTFAQNKVIQNAIIDEGKKLYQSEMASWIGTDLILL